MHLMYTLDPSGKRLYTLKKVVGSEVTKSAHPARFSPDDKYSRHRVTLKKRYGLLLTQQSRPSLRNSFLWSRANRFALQRISRSWVNKRRCVRNLGSSRGVQIFVERNVLTVALLEYTRRYGGENWRSFFEAVQNQIQSLFGVLFPHRGPRRHAMLSRTPGF